MQKLLSILLSPLQLASNEISFFVFVLVGGGGENLILHVSEPLCGKELSNTHLLKTNSQPTNKIVFPT